MYRLLKRFRMQIEETFVRLTRKELYDFLTDMPISKFADKYNLIMSDLIQCLKKYHIPRRSSGDWTKISMGQNTEREPLDGNPGDLVRVQRDTSDPSIHHSSNKQIKKSASVPPSRSSAYPRYPYPAIKSYKSYSRHVSTTKQNSRKKKQSNGVDTRAAQDRLSKYNQTLPLYEILSVAPNEELYNRVTVFELNLPVRAINGLMRAKLENMHKIMSISID